MRLLTGLCVAILLVSAWFAPRVHREREGVLPDEAFLGGGWKERAARGEREHALGVALTAYELAYKEDPEDLEALRGRFRTGLLLGAVALGQPRLHELVAEQTDAYVERRDRLDPDGSLLQETLHEWVRLRFENPIFYAGASLAIWLSARGDDEGFRRLRDYVDKGPFFHEFFPYVRRFHPHWRGVEPLVDHYLTSADLQGRVEAGVTLIEYRTLYGTGNELWKRFGKDVREALAHMAADIRGKPELDAGQLGRGATAIYGLAMLAALGHAPERRLVAALDWREYPQFTDSLKIARILAGLTPWERYLPTTNNFRILRPEAQEEYYRAAAFRALVLRGQLEQKPGEERRAGLEKEYDLVRNILDAGLNGPDTVSAIGCLEAIATLEGPAAQPLLRQVIDGRGVPSLFAAALVDELEDPVAVLLPGIRSPQPDYAALAAVSLLDLGDRRPLQRAAPPAR